MTVRSWLRHPPRRIHPRVCPTGLPRFAKLELARRALIYGLAPVGLTAVPCDLCRGAHLVDQPPATPRPARPAARTTT